MSKWDKRFLTQAMLVSSWSKDPKHKVGAIIVDKCNRQISMGFNGPPRGVIDTGLHHRIKVMRTIHAELNAILNSNVSLEGCTMYIYPFSPCAQCAAAIIQKGITRIVYSRTCNLKTWEASQKEAFIMFKEAGVKIEQYVTV